MISRRAWMVLLCAGGACFAQRRSRQNGSKATGAGGQSPEEVLIRFPGILKSIDKKQILIETGSEQDLTFRRTKRTRFFDGEKEAKESAAPVGEGVVIEGRRQMNGDLDAIHVIWNEKPASPEPR